MNSHARAARERVAFKDWMQHPVPQGRRLRTEFLAKLYFMQGEPPAVAEQEAKAAVMPAAQWSKRCVHDFRTGQIRGLLGWPEACADDVPAMTDARD